MPRPYFHIGRHVTPWLALAGLAFLVYAVMAPFWGAITWAGIIAYTTWPGYAWLRRRVGGSDTWAALLATLLVTLTLLAPVFSLVWVAEQELAKLVVSVRAMLAQPPEVPAILRSLPWLGDWLDSRRALWLADPGGSVAGLTAWLTPHATKAAKLAGGLGRGLVEIVLMLAVLFFAYRDGQGMMGQLKNVLARFLGRRVHGYLAAAAATTRAVVYGILLTALVQGAVAGLGYWFGGVDSPIVASIITFAFALIPFGAMLAWGGVGGWLALQGDMGGAVVVWLWGALVVSQIDNVVRPLAISRAGDIPFLLVLFGVFGGVMSFGFVGLFAGPVILAVALAVWREWTSQLGK